MYNLIFHPEAETDFAKAVAFYKAESKLSAMRFASEIENCIEKIYYNPILYPRIFRNSRHCILKIFPYRIIYTVKKGEILILSIFHHKRNPKIWKSRNIK